MIIEPVTFGPILQQLDPTQEADGTVGSAKHPDRWEGVPAGRSLPGRLADHDDLDAELS